MVQVKPGKTIVGLTGVFGAGKSTVANLMEELGAEIVDADKLAHEALLEGSSVYEQAAGKFQEARQPGALGLDRKKLAGIIFKDEKRRKELEQIVHPYVRERALEEVANAQAPVVILEVPLLFEAKFDRFCDVTVTVTADEKIMDGRLIEKGFSREEITARRKAQFSQEEKAKRADKVINNSGTLKETKREVEKIWKDLSPRFDKGEK
jgi:dephospho-CoA kinase